MLGLTPILNFFAQTDRGEFEQSELFIIGFVPIVLAVVIFFIGVKLHHKGKPGWIKWLAFIPLAIGLIMGIAPTQAFYGDPFYKEYYGGTWKKGVLHAMGIIMAVIGAIGLAIWNKWLARQSFEDL